jgi:AcrR family transcriptional regulator
MTLEHGAVREALIGMTLKLMDKGGLGQVKARLVAQLAGVSVGTIYNLFGSFERLIVAANLRIYADLAALGEASLPRIEAEVQARIAAGGLPGGARGRTLARLRGLADVYVEFVSANSNRWAALLAFNRSRNLRDNAENQQHLDSLIDIVGMALEEVPRWSSASERRLAARALWSAVHGVVTTNFFGGEPGAARTRTSHLLDLLMTLCVDGMFAEPAPVR